MVTLPLLLRASVGPGGHRALALRLLRLFPASPYLAAALAALDRTAHTLSRLRLDLLSLVAHPQARSVMPLQLCAAACEARRPGGFYLRNLFEKALAPADTLDLSITCTALRERRRELERSAAQQPAWCAATEVAAGEGGVTHLGASVECVPGALLARGSLQDSPALWLAYLQWVAAHGTPREVKGVFLRAVSVCPWSKGLWMRGLLLVASSLRGREASDLLEVMASRGIAVETHAMEVLLEALEAEA